MNLLLSEPKKFKPPPSFHSTADGLCNMGFEKIKVYLTLKDKKGDMEKSIEALTSFSDSTEFKAPKSDLKKKDPIAFQTDWVRQHAKTVSSNMFVCLYYWFRRRLRRYTQYCVICSSIHKCNGFATKPLVCSKPLCVFRWEDRKMGDLHDTKLCKIQF